MSLNKVIATAVTKALLNKLPGAVAEKYKKIDEESFKEFLQEWLAAELKVPKGKGGPKAEKGKGRTTGFLLFSSAHRDQVKDEKPDLKFGEVGKELGNMWKELKEKEKNKWNDKAAAQNKENGIEPKKAAPAKKGSVKSKATPATPAKGKKAAPTKKATPAKAKKVSTEKPATVKLQRHKEAKKWVIEGTEFVVQSPKDKVVLGKLNDENEVVPLSAADKKKCTKNGWEVKVEEKKGKGSKKEPESSSEGSDNEGSEGSDNEGSEEASGEGDAEASGGGDAEGSNDDDSE